ncbi:MAG: LL-diaminopimelate aminotransferase [Kiritimatiellae bacterium]|nr:LL-diaminopimelate aminotransferase [Kiritimatiellia bacterium]MDD4342217.1 LL-diaminopimelate aminotransferase [Kiritimatiellia bacterium]
MNIQNLFAERIGGAQFGQDTAIYKFEKIKRAKAAARAAHPEVEMLDFGVGEPDQMAPRAIRQALKKAVDDPANRGYADNGIVEFRRAAGQYMAEFFGVSGLDLATEINHTIGAKPALAMIPLCFINPGDAVLATIPGYPVLATHTRYLGGSVIPVPLLAKNKFFPDLKALEQMDLSRVKLFYVNYPNNPTGAAATDEFFDELIAFAQQHNILIVQDAAYATLVYGRERLSILARPGGKEAAVELHSMSKSYNMTGWRLGFVAGSAQAVAAVAEVKDNIDSGQFKAIQQAACAGIANIKLSEKIRAHYQRRLRKLVKVLKAAGFKAKMPGGTFYLYVPAPKGTTDGRVFANAEEATEYLITEHCISTVPWDDAGAFLRFGATFESTGRADDARVLDELGRRLASAGLVF